MIKFRNFLFYFVSGAISLILAAVLSLVIVIMVKSQTSPLDITFLKPYLQSLIHKKDENYRIDFTKASVSWESLNAPIRFSVTDVSFKNNEYEHANTTHFYVGHCDLSYSLKKIIFGREIPTSLVLNHVRSQYVIKSSPDSLGSEKRSETVSVDIDALQEKLVSLSHMKKIDVHDAEIILIRDDKKHVFHLEGDIDFSSQKQQGSFQISLKDSPAYLDIQAALSPDADAIQAKVVLQDVSSQSLFSVLGMSFDNLLHFENSRLKIDYTYDFNNREQKAHLSCLLDEVCLNEKSLWTQKLLIPHINFGVSLKGDTFVFDPIVVDLKDISFSVTGDGRFADALDHMDINLKIASEDFQFDKVGSLWPLGAANEARTWLITNMKQATISKATSHIRGRLNLVSPQLSSSKQAFELRSLNGEIQFSDCLLTYLETMSPLTHLKGKATYNHDHFDIKIISGTHNGLMLSKGHVYIGPFSNETPHIDIEAHLSGQVNEALHLLEQDPLNYASQIGIDPTDVTGHVQGVYKMSFPLSGEAKTPNYSTYFKGDIKDICISKYQDIPINFKGGEASVELTPELLSIDGFGQLSNLPAHITAKQDFEKEKTTVKLTSLIDGQTLYDYFPGVETLLKGQAPVELVYKKPKESEGTVSVHADLSKMFVNTLLMQKTEMVPAYLDFQAAINAKSIQPTGPLVYSDHNGWRLSLDIPPSVFERKASPNAHNGKQFTFTAMRHEKDILTGTYSFNQSEDHVKIQANELDLKWFMETNWDAFSKGNTNEPPKPLHIHFTAKYVTMGHPQGLSHIDFYSCYQKKRLHKLKFTASTEKQNKPHENLVSNVFAELTTDRKNERKLRLQTNQGGHFLQALGLFQNIRGGQLEIVAKNSPLYPDDHWHGMGRVRLFSLLETPFVARILSLIPSGSSELIGETGLKMDLLKMRFGVTKSQLSLLGLQAQSISTGINMSGVINRTGDKKVNLSGRLIPLRVMNKMISSIPVVGPLITGGKNEGLLSFSFGVGGTMDAPKVSSNPASVLSLGIMKQMFSQQDESFLRQDEWLNEGDKSGDLFDQEFSALQ